jgi:predicted dehydrogenase/threonine dehydrogenase-like Zn-dependent dehydrogenase
MKQVLIKKGQIYTEQIPSPVAEEGMVLVQTAYSCISAGTEMAGVASAGRSIIQRIKDNPQLIARGLDLLKQKGFKQTMGMVKEKVEASLATGYSASGVVIESGVPSIKVGDRVACMGTGYANHAGIICVPANLVAKIPENVSFEEGSTAALGCIAMQGIRRADVKLGEYVYIIGMGILGQLTLKMALLSGATVIVSDMDERRLETARKAGAQYAINAKDDVVSIIQQITAGHGVDKVIVTAASDSDAILSQAFQVSRRKGRVVLVGVAGMNLNRDDMYAKELELLIATSYGPGRYDSSYEEQGIDYPYAYVRFTEQRNLESYLRLINEKRLNISDIIEKVYPVEQADEAYNEFKKPNDRPLIVLLSYVEKDDAKTLFINAHKEDHSEKSKKNDILNVAICGAGSFAKNVHLPNLQSLKDKYRIYAIQSRTGANANEVAKIFDAEYATTDYNRILKDDNIDVVIICTRHDLHADMAVQALRAGKSVFVEKPMALNEADVKRVIRAINETGNAFMIGYNRRFSPCAIAVKKEIAKRNGPLMVYYRMNAGYIPLDNWVHTKEGGGRIIGEGCHILDLFAYLTDSSPISVSVDRINDSNRYFMDEDNCTISVKYSDGSVCTLLYTAMGNKEFEKEYAEIYCDGKVYLINDYKTVKCYGGNIKEVKGGIQDKGHKNEMVEFYHAIQSSNKYPIPLEQLLETSMLSLLINSNN